jgi:hypothetical protein
MRFDDEEGRGGRGGERGELTSLILVRVGEGRLSSVVFDWPLSWEARRFRKGFEEEDGTKIDMGWWDCLWCVAFETLASVVEEVKGDCPFSSSSPSIGVAHRFLRSSEDFLPSFFFTRVRSCWSFSSEEEEVVAEDELEV